MTKKEAHAAYMKAWRRKNPAKVKAIETASKKRNAVKVNARLKAYKEKNRAHLNERRTAWRRANQARQIEVNKAYVAKNKTRVQRIQAKCQGVRRAKKHDVFVEIVDNELIRQRDKNRCGICGMVVKLGQRGEADHIVPLSRGGTHCYANLQWSHLECNRRKSADMPTGQFSFWQFASTHPELERKER